MKQGAESPLVTTGLEQFRDAATWQAVITNLTSSAAAYEVHGYGGGSVPPGIGWSQTFMISRTLLLGLSSLRQCIRERERSQGHCSQSIINFATVA